MWMDSEILYINGMEVFESLKYNSVEMLFYF